MWDLKLFFITNFFLYLNIWSIIIIENLLEFLDPLLNTGSSLINLIKYYIFAQNLTFFFSIKFLFCIAFLILIRGGTPRYRYDYLTKLGWLKFIGLVFFVFILSLFFFFLF